MKSMQIEFGSLSDVMEASGDVPCMFRQFIVDRHLDGSFVVNHNDCRRIRKGQLRLVVIPGAEIFHVI